MWYIFTKSESGAVTVDWVVLTAGLVGLGLATMGVVSSGVEDLSGDVDTELRDTRIFSSFEVQNNVDLYDAILARGALNKHRRGQGWTEETFYTTLDFLQSSSDQDLLDGISQTWLDDANAALTGLKALDQQNPSITDIAAANGQAEATIDANIADRYDGSASDYLEAELSHWEWQRALQEARRDEAEQRGLSY